MHLLPFSADCERHRAPILEHLRPFFADRRRVLEIGSGTGQHAEFFAQAMPELTWQCSDRPDYLPGLLARVETAALNNLPAPLEFDVADAEWPSGFFDALYSANTLHIMAWEEVQAMFAGLPEISTHGCKLAVYGPFNYAGRFTSDSNEAFDADLRARAAHMGIRDVADIDRLASEAGFELVDDIAMPANNRLRLWQAGG